MFDALSGRLSDTLNRLRGQGRLTDEQVQQAVRELRMALLEADVALPAVRSFVEQVRERASGAAFAASLSPGEAFLRIVHGALAEALGGEAQPLNLRAQPPVVILLCGLQGAGKTTTAGKLARRLKGDGKSVLAVSCDTYRPAAAKQLATVMTQAGVGVHHPVDGEAPVDIARGALAAARTGYADVLLVDTAGRTSVDEAMMDEVAVLHDALSPTETLFVIDAMAGQSAATTAKDFAKRVALTGIVLSKADGDARGGGALSVRSVTGAPIKFIGTGEQQDGLEPFDPARMAGRILGQGDVQSLIEDTAQRVDHGKAEKLARKLKKSGGFDLADFRGQLDQMRALGGLKAMVDKLPGGEKVRAQMATADPDADLKRSIAIIDSMTRKERRFPAQIKASHRKRIAAGSGTQVQDVNRLIRQFDQARTMMKRMGRGGMKGLMRGLAGRLPPGSMPGR